MNLREPRCKLLLLMLCKLVVCCYTLCVLVLTKLLFPASCLAFIGAYHRQTHFFSVTNSCPGLKHTKTSAKILTLSYFKILKFVKKINICTFRSFLYARIKWMSWFMIANLCQYSVWPTGIRRQIAIALYAHRCVLIVVDYVTIAYDHNLIGSCFTSPRELWCINWLFRRLTLGIHF